jgi:NAD(P)-dependent dehydrogenase (short-subunit alcohol dehydrogenase family)
VFSAQALLGKRILVTGASSGIGRATAVLASKCGAHLIVTARSSERLAQTLADMEGTDHIARVLALDDLDAMAADIIALAKSHGPLDGIFHSAGIGLVKPIRLTKQQNVVDVFAASVIGTFAVARAAASKDVIAGGGGSVVVMSSVAAQRGQPGMSVYSASKGAVDAAVRSLAGELAAKNIRVNCIAAGAVATEMHERTVGAMTPDAVADYANKHWLGFGEPQDVAQVAVFLLSAASRWITGATWAVDGGYLAK